MGCFCSGKSDVDDLHSSKEANDGHQKGKHSYVKSWHDDLTLAEKKKIARKYKHGECFICKCCGVFGVWSGLKCCCCHFNPKEPFLSVNKDRHCTDVPCCCLFVITLLLQFGLFMTAITDYNADPRWLIYYSDWEGNLCAPTYDDIRVTVNTTTGGNYCAWPDIRMYDIRVCVDHCNDTLDDPRMVTPPFDTDIDDIDGLNVDLSGYSTRNVFDAYCIPNPDAVSSIVSDALNADYSAFERKLDKLTDEVSLAVNDMKVAWVMFILCAISALCVSMLWGWLIRHIGAFIIWFSIFFTLFGMFLLAYFLVQYSEYAYAFGYDTLGDVMYYSGWTIGVIDCMLALAVCFMWTRIRLAIALAKETTRALNDMIALFLYPIVPFLSFATYVSYWMVTGIYIGSVLDKKTWPFPDGYKWPYYTGGPTLQSALNLPGKNAEYQYLDINETWQYLFLLHFFILLWMVNFISYHTYMVIAGVYAEWYFADWKDKAETQKWRGSDDSDVLVKDGKRVESKKENDAVNANLEIEHQQAMEIEMAKHKKKGKGGFDEFMQKKGKKLNKKEQKAADAKDVGTLEYITKLSRFPVFASFKRITLYHSGTIAFASLLIAIIEFIEYTLTYFEKKFIGAEPSPLQQMIICMIRALLKCIKCILNRINRNGLIITSIYGWPFCAASMKGIMIVLKNVIRAAALDMVSGYLEKLGKVCIISFNVAFSVVFANYYYGNELSSIFFPTLVCLGITYVICWQYMHLYEVGISAIFICFLIDEERNKNLGEMKASHRLRKIIGAQKPPKKYLIAKTKSVRVIGMTDEAQRRHFSHGGEFNLMDERMATQKLLVGIQEPKEANGHNKGSSSVYEYSLSLDDDQKKSDDNVVNERIVREQPAPYRTQSYDYIDDELADGHGCSCFSAKKRGDQ